MINPISSGTSAPSVPTLSVSAPTGLTDKYLRYLDTLSNLKENTAHLLEKTRELPSCSDLTQYELFSRQNEELQILFKKAMAQVREDCEQLGKLTFPTPPQIYYQKNFTEAIDDMDDALQEHTNALIEFNKTILAKKEKPESKSPPSPKKNQTHRLRIFSVSRSFQPASPETPTPPVLVRQKALWDVSPLQSSTPPSPPALTHQTTDVFSTPPKTPPSAPSPSSTLQSLRRRDTDVTLLHDPVFLDQILRQGPPPTSTFSPPPAPSLSTRLWRGARSLFSFSKKKKWVRLSED